MLLRDCRDPDWLGNSSLGADGRGGRALLIDSGGPLQEQLDACAELEVRPELILNTHRHPDHVANNLELARRFDATICSHRLEARWTPGATRHLEHEEEVELGELRVKVLHVPGHTSGHLVFHVDDLGLFTGDVLFRGSVGGTCGVGHTTATELRHGIIAHVATLPPRTTVWPGHMERSSVEQELLHNPFLRHWLGEGVVQEQPCQVAGRAAVLLLRAADYDGGTKCLVRWADGSEDLVPGSQVNVVS
jgi:glyoxylase-like metal-dependent hydrolase (beta-lactamase superfamily II)